MRKILVVPHGADRHLIRLADTSLPTITEKRRSNKLVFVAARHAHDEIKTYVEFMTGFAGYSHAIIEDPLTLLNDELRRFYIGRAKLYDKLDSFFSYRKNNRIEIDTLVDERELSYELSQIRDRALSGYLDSRRAKSGAQEDAFEYISYIDTMEIDGPVVLHIPNGITYNQAIIIDNALKAKKKYPIIIVADPIIFRNYKVNSHYELNPLTLGDLATQLKDYTGWTEAQFIQAYESWIGGRYRRSITSDHSLTLHEANDFFSFAQSSKFEIEEAPEAKAKIPTSIPAPVMFEEGQSEIDIDRSSVVGTSSFIVQGAARALRNQAKDLLYVGVGNAIPRAQAVVYRLIDVLDRVAAESASLQSDVVELGVESGYLERMMIYAQSTYGADSMIELVAFVGESNKFLSKFDFWRQYKYDSAIQSADKETAELAVSILRAASAAGLLTDNANKRVIENIPTGIDITDEGKREGVVRSTENLTAALGRSALRLARKTGDKALDQGTDRLAKGLSAASEQFLKRHSSSLLSLAAKRSEGWLAMIVNLFGG